jgi:hypothetical protein
MAISTAFKSAGSATQPVTPPNSSAEPPRAGDRALTKTNAENDTDLSRVLAAWPKLPEAIRKAMLALAESGQ